MSKKIIAAILIAATCFACLAAFTACDNDGDKLSIVYLGDSIGEAVAGPSPVEEKDSMGYPGIVGQINDYYYHNRAISGHKTYQLLDFINREDTNAAISCSLIKTADVIHVSILGNDLLQADFGTMLYDRKTTGTSVTFNNAIATAEENIEKIIVRLRELNPTAHIMFQNVYNPVYAESPLLESSVKERLATVDVNPADYRTLASELLVRLDSIVPNYLDEHPDDKIHVIDAYSAFDRIFNSDPERGKRLIFVDGVHPSNEGHAVLAGLIQDKLVELGLANAKDGLKSYKQLRTEQVDRLYSETSLDRAALKKAINSADTFDKVTTTYFDGVRNYVAKCGSCSLPRNYADDTYVFDSDREFFIDKITLDNTGFPDLAGTNLAGFFDEESSFFFGNDGTFVTTVKISPSLLTVVSALLKTLDFEELMQGKVMGDIDVTGIITLYCENLFTGASVDDFAGALELLEGSLGASLIGAENIDINELWRSITEDGKLPDDFALGNEFGIQIESTYCIKKVKGADGKEWTALYIGRFDPDTEPFLIFTLREDGTVATVDVTMEILGLSLYGTERTEQAKTK